MLNINSDESIDQLRALHNITNGHILLNTPVLVRSPKLSSDEPSQYLEG